MAHTPGGGAVGRSPLQVGDPLPNLSLVDHEGRRWSPGEVSRTTLLVFHRHLA